MKTKKMLKKSIFVILLTFAIITMFSCKNVSEDKISEKKIELNPLNVDSIKSKNESKENSIINQQKKESFTLSCGSGCAMIYNEESRSSDNFKVEINFKVEMYINEVLTEENTEIYIFECDSKGKLKSIRLKNSKENILLDDSMIIRDELKRISKTLCNNNSNDLVKLPFDYQKYMDNCYLEDNTKCKEEYPFYQSSELESITTLINSKINKNNPNRIYCIDNGGLPFETYIFEIRNDNQDYLLDTMIINIKNNTLIGKQLIAISIDGEAPEDVNVINKTFIIDKDLSISIYDKIHNIKNKLSDKFKINPDGTIVKL
jgi:hypothetical protein